jgi:hypothetical protein
VGSPRRTAGRGALRPFEASHTPGAPRVSPSTTPTLKWLARQGRAPSRPSSCSRRGKVTWVRRGPRATVCRVQSATAEPELRHDDHRPWRDSRPGDRRCGGVRLVRPGG